MDFIKLREKLLNNAAGRVFLAFAAFVYGLGVKFVLLSYKKGWLARKAVNSRVVCIGNITAGGTGKTTAVLLCAAKLSEAGIRTAVVSRGYKRSAKKDEVVVLFDKDLLNWRESGDEPYMMSQLLAEYKVPVVVGSDRYAAASQALTEEQLALIRTYMSFGEDGLTIGKSGNPLTFRVVNDRLAFYMNNIATLSSIRIERGTLYPFARSMSFSVTATF